MRAGTPLKQFRNSFNFIKTIHDLNSRYENGRHYQFCVIVLKSIDFHNLPDFRAPPTLQTRWYKRLPLMLRSHYIEAAPVGCPPPSGQTTSGKKKKSLKMSKMTIVQLGMVLFAICLSTQVRYHSQSSIFFNFFSAISR